MNEEEQDSQVGNQAKQLAKDMIKNGAKQGFKKLGSIVISLISPILPYVLGALLVVAVIGVGIDWLVDVFTVEASAQTVQTTLADNTKIEDGTWVIDSEVSNTILKTLKADGLTLSGLSEKDLHKLIEAEFVTTHPKLSDKEGLQGIVTFTRRDYDAEEDDDGTPMTYMEKDEFDKYVKESTEDAYKKIRNRFTLEEQTTTTKVGEEEKTEKEYIVVIAKYTKVSGSESKFTISTEKVKYKMMVQNFTTPLEFLISNYQMSNSREYVLAIADMIINNSTIDFCIQDQYSKVEETPVEEWDEYTYTTIYEGDKLVNIEKSSTEHKVQKGSTKITETITFVPYIKKIDTWIAKAEQNYNKKEEHSGPNRVGETSLETVTIKNGNTVTHKTNRFKYTETTTTKVTYVSGITTTNDNVSLGAIDADLETLLTEVKQTWPQGMEEGRITLIEKAASLVNKGCKYSQNLRDPKNSKPSYLDCSSYVAWAFTQTGHSDVPVDAYTGTFVSSNVFKAISQSELMPGDIGLNNATMAAGSANHIGIYIGKNSSGQNIWLHCTSTGINGPQSRIGNGNFKVFYRYTNW